MFPILDTNLWIYPLWIWAIRDLARIICKNARKIVNAKSIKTIDLYNRIEGHRSLSSKQKMAVRVRSNRRPRYRKK